jgi:hypothetical protein
MKEARTIEDAARKAQVEETGQCNGAFLDMYGINTMGNTG